MELEKKCMLAKLSISQWNLYKKDKNASVYVEKEFQANGKAGNFNKILTNNETLKKARTIATTARTYHYQFTLPWSDDGSRILPSKKYFEYTDKMRSFKNELEQVMSKIDYSEILNEAKQRLGNLFNPSDYPDDIKFKFHMSVEIYPLPKASDFRVTLNKNEHEKIQKEIEENVKKKINNAHMDLYKRLIKNMERVVEKLSDTDAIFRDSLIRNICELCDTIPDLNLIDDIDLKQLVDDIKRKLCHLDPNDLRKDEKIRKEKAFQARNLLDALGEKWNS